MGRVKVASYLHYPITVGRCFHGKVWLREEGISTGGALLKGVLLKGVLLKGVLLKWVLIASDCAWYNYAASSQG